MPTHRMPIDSAPTDRLPTDRVPTDHEPTDRAPADHEPSEAHSPLRAALGHAVDHVEHPAAGPRLAGLRRIVALADAVPALRRPVVAVLGAYLRRPPRTDPDGRLEDVEAAIRADVVDAVREHLRDPEHPTSWCGLDVDLRDAVLVGDLSGIVVDGGSVRLDRARVPYGSRLDVRDVTVRAGLLSLDRLTVAGTLDATGLVVTGGEASLDRLTTTGTVRLDRARVVDGALWLRGGAVDGVLSLRGSYVGGGRLSLHDTRVRGGGGVRLDGTCVDGGTVHLSGTTVESGELRLDDVRIEAGVLSLALTTVQAGRLSLAGVTVGAAGTLRAQEITAYPAGTIWWGSVDGPPDRTGETDDVLDGAPEVPPSDAPKVPTAPSPARHLVPSPRRRHAA